MVQMRTANGWRQRFARKALRSMALKKSAEDRSCEGVSELFSTDGDGTCSAAVAVTPVGPRSSSH